MYLLSRIISYIIFPKIPDDICNILNNFVDKFQFYEFRIGTEIINDNVVIAVSTLCTRHAERGIINIRHFVRVLVVTVVPASRDMTYERQRLDFTDFRSK